MAELLLPRNEYEICELFEDLLFMRTEKFSFSQTEPREDKYRLSEKGLEAISKIGVLNRIFRRWFQTTWGWNTWSRQFEGETPRQELSNLYSDFTKGRAMFSVELRKENNVWKVVPHLFFEKEMGRGNNFFLYGLREAERKKGKILKPNFDPGFRDFLQRLFNAEEKLKKLKSYSPPSSQKEKYWRIFWLQAGPSLVFSISLDLSKKDLVPLGVMFQDCLEEFIHFQGTALDDFISVDELVFEFWRILQKSDQRLLPFEVMTTKEEKVLSRLLSQKKSVYSLAVFYSLGMALDEKILFPIDRYFGSAEIVWTDKASFLQTLAVTIELGNKGFKMPPSAGKNKEKSVLWIMGLEDTVFDVMRSWFALPTSFRLLEPVLKYF